MNSDINLVTAWEILSGILPVLLSAAISLYILYKIKRRALLFVPIIAITLFVAVRHPTKERILADLESRGIKREVESAVSVLEAYRARETKYPEKLSDVGFDSSRLQEEGVTYSAGVDHKIKPLFRFRVNLEHQYFAFDPPCYVEYVHDEFKEWIVGPCHT